MKFSRDAAIPRIPAPHLLKQGQLQLAGASFRDEFMPRSPANYGAGSTPKIISFLLRLGDWNPGAESVCRCVPGRQTINGCLGITLHPAPQADPAHQVTQAGQLALGVGRACSKRTLRRAANPVKVRHGQAIWKQGAKEDPCPRTS